MSRLLFAAARGARIEAKCQIDPDVWDKWRLCEFVAWSDFHRDEYQFRIHPGDAHLAYGPISTALREAAAGFFVVDWTVTGLPRYLCSEVMHWHNLAESSFGEHCEPLLHRSLFLLILAEALADEGL